MVVADLGLTRATDAATEIGSAGVAVGDVVRISSKDSVFAGPNDIACPAVEAGQAHQVRLLAAELSGHRPACAWVALRP